MSYPEAVELAKMMVSRRMQKEGIVPYHGFWNDPPWKRLFKEQIIAAQALLKVYSFIAMMNVLNRDCQWAYSLRTKVLQELFEVEQRKVDMINKKAQEAEEIKVTESTQVQGKFGGKTNPLKNL